MKTTKTLLAILMSAFLTMTVFPIGAFAADATVTSIVADDVTVYFESDGRWHGNHPNGVSGGDNYAWFLYELTPDITVFYSDGSSAKAAFYDVYPLVGYSPTVRHNQSKDNEWEIGKHTASIICGDFTDEFTVTVLPSPAVSMTVQDATVRQYIDGSHSTESLFLYTLNPILTVTFNDGTVITGTRGDIQEQCGYQVYWDSDQSTAGEWGVGDHTATALFMGLRAEFTVTVVDIVTSVEMITPPTNTSLLYGEYVDLRGSVLRVHFDDGSYEDVSPINTHNNNILYMLNTVQRSCLLTIAPLRVTESGLQDITIRFLGETVTFTVGVAPKPVSLQLTSNEDHSLSLTFDYGDSTQTCRILDFVSSSGGQSNNGDIRKYGTLYTDDGLFLASIGKTLNGTMFVELGTPYYEGGVYAVSNTIPGTYWFDYYNGTLAYGDFDGNGKTDTADVRGLLKALASFSSFDDMQINICDVNDNGLIDTADTRLILTRLLA